jgi:hypothetical protein
MESRIPLPTDNIFKFYALFGLLLLVFGLGATIYSTKSRNEFLTSAVVEIETLKAVVGPTAGQAARKQVLERLIEVVKSDKELFKWASAVMVGVGFWMMVIGFWIWHVKVQRVQDELTTLQLRKLRTEIAQLERSGARVRLNKRA